MAVAETVVIVNPHSQGGALGRRWPELSATLRRHASFDVKHTERPGHASELVAEALRAGASTVVAVGGDGTINEVVNGFFADGRAIAPHARLGILPVGTGGDFRRTLGLSTDFAEACVHLAAGATRRIDVGRLDYTTTDGGAAVRMFINVASFGISGVVDRLVNESGKRLGGRATFLWASIRAAASYDNQRVRLRLDGGAPVDLTINVCAIANGKYFGGGMKIAPEAALDDGQFDVVALGDLTFGESLGLARSLYAGTHIHKPKVSVRRARVVEAEPASPEQQVELDVDGETPGRLPAKFSVVPAALAVIVPAGA